MHVWERELINLAFPCHGKSYLWLEGLSLIVDVGTSLILDVKLTIEGNPDSLLDSLGSQHQFPIYKDTGQGLGIFFFIEV